METERSHASPRDIFTHLLSIVSLYVSSIAFGTLLFQFINISFPDPLTGGWAAQSARSILRFSIASLVIAFPVHIATARYLLTLYVKTPAKLDLRIRKWLMYFTLFVTSLIIMGDLIALINSFLGGDLTVRFTLKVATILAVSGAIFFYYISDLRRNNPHE